MYSGMSGQGGDIELWMHIPHWWNYEVAGNDLPEFMFHGTTHKADRSIRKDKELRAGSLIKRGQKGNYIVTFA